MIGEKGSAAIELAAALPLLALCMIVMVQLMSVFVEAQRDLMAADVRIAETMRSHMNLEADHAFEWPCLERVAVGSEGRVVIDKKPRTIGVGLLRRTIDAPQEVRFVTEPICGN